MDDRTQRFSVNLHMDSPFHREFMDRTCTCCSVFCFRVYYRHNLIVSHGPFNQPATEKGAGILFMRLIR